ncbi:hypothetical protein [Streptomyces sp. ODS05-4]|uniref:hypothetical protein n=1 Tax=Streptomyces sp. ODS05-4 TaxID=2944939 RepID=UPI00210A2143|nr:hypothetical protein [Streptomyces sp. ODS05-4]
MTDARSPLRALRAALFAAVCVTLAAVGHSSQSASPSASLSAFRSAFRSGSPSASLPAHDIPVGSLLLAFAATGVLAWAAAGRRRGVWYLGAALVAGQGALHTVFGLGGPGHGHTAHHPSGHQDDPAAELLSALLSGATPGMAAVHLLAAALCAVWLARGEAAFFQAARALGNLAAAPLRLLPTAVALPRTPRPPRPRAAAPRRHRGVVLAHSVCRRGPPAPSAPRATAPAPAHS